jgi:hypothetical protein
MNQATTGMARPGRRGGGGRREGFGGGAGGEVAERGPEGAREIGLGEGFAFFFFSLSFPRVGMQGLVVVEPGGPATTITFPLFSCRMDEHFCLAF